jgi:hypothetical protein
MDPASSQVIKLQDYVSGGYYLARLLV